MAAAIPWIIMGVGTALSASGTMGEGTMQADQYARNAKASEATGTRRAAEVRRQGDIVKSDTAAAMVAGGGVTSDVGAISTLADIEQVVDYNALSALYEGSARADDLDYAGKIAKKTGKTKAFGTALSSAGSMMGKS